VNYIKIYFGPSKRDIIDYLPYTEQLSQWLACQFKKKNIYFFQGNYFIKVKVKFILEQATKAQMWSRGIALLFL